MEEHELGITALFNEYLPGLGHAILPVFGIGTPEKPWENWIVVELMVVALLMLLVAVLRPRLKVDAPGKTQHVFELFYEFLSNTADEVGLEHKERFIPYFASVAILILSLNLVGLIPVFESPTNFPWVPCGLAICTFVYYNYMGFRYNGFKYLLHFAGPVWWLAWLMVPIELISHFARPLSLTVRLYGNMFAGEQVSNVFLQLTYFIIPVVFMGLHLFVAFVQTYIFTLLTMIYVSGSTSHEH